jgi:type I restriction enzyme, R subunit
MLRIFDERVAALIDGQAKAMIVATSRVAGLRYFEIINEKLRERGNPYKVLYAFSDFVHPETNQQITETKVNGLEPGELIEDRFEGDDYRLMIVASKFQTGFDQPLLAGMFLDKAVVDRNAVQTVSRLNRQHDGKDTVVVVDFTNNAHAILKAFQKYRKCTPFEPVEPDKEQCVGLYREIIAAGVFTQEDADHMVKLLADDKDAPIQFTVNALRNRFRETVPDPESQKEFVFLLDRFVKSYNFLMCFFVYAREIGAFAAFAAYVGPQLIKIGSVSDLMKQVRKTHVVKAAVTGGEEVAIPGGTVKPKKKRKGGGGGAVKKVTVQDMIDEILQKFQISEEEALYIREVTQEKMEDEDILGTIAEHREDTSFLDTAYKRDVNYAIQDAYADRGRQTELGDPRYYEPGAIFDIMALVVIQYGLQVAKAA